MEAGRLKKYTSILLSKLAVYYRRMTIKPFVDSLVYFFENTNQF